MNQNNDFDPFVVLGVTIDSTEAEIKKAYKKMSIKFHPDKNKDSDATERFQECSKAQDMLLELQDPQLKQAYLRGGWEFVDKIKQHRHMREQTAKVCPPFGIKLPVTLRQLIQRKKLKITSDIPVLDEKGDKVKTKKFEMELEMNPHALGKRQIVQHHGIERPDFVPGDVVIELDIEWEREPTKFDINNGDLVYRHKLNAWEAFGAFDFSFLHPSDVTYRVTDYYNHPEDDGEQTYVVTGAGLTSDDNLIVIVSIDYGSFSKARERESIQSEIASALVREPSEVSDKQFNVVANSTAEFLKLHISSQRHHMGFPFRMDAGGPGDCHQQ